jgi:hypothetical protein
VNFSGRELGVEEEERMSGGGRRMRHPCGGIAKRAPAMLVPYKTCRAPTSLAPWNLSWHGLVHVYMDDANEANAL